MRSFVLIEGSVARLQTGLSFMRGKTHTIWPEMPRPAA